MIAMFLIWCAILGGAGIFGFVVFLGAWIFIENRSDDEYEISDPLPHDCADSSHMPQYMHVGAPAIVQLSQDE